MDYIICRYGELALKGKNRFLFENKLISNIKACLEKNRIRYEKISKPPGRILIKTNLSCNYLKNIFGLVSFSPSISTNLDLNEIKKIALKFYKIPPFRISAQRISKVFMTSQKINEEVGAFIVRKTKAKVNLKNPKTEIGIEIIDNKAYIFNKKIPCPGGLPVGIAGLVTLLLEDKNSLKAGYLMLKRGCSIEIIKKKNIPFKSLENYSYGNKINVVKQPSKNSYAIIVSDTLKDIKKRKYKLPIFYPLLVYPKNETI